MPIAAILLAAGESTRMGTLKALLPWNGATLLEYQVAQLRASRCGEVVVVLGYEAERLRGLLGEPGTSTPSFDQPRRSGAIDGATTPRDLSASREGDTEGKVRVPATTSPSSLGESRSRSALPPLRAVVNPDYRLGKTSSIRAVVEAVEPGATAALILAVDQPRPAWLLDQLIVEHERARAAISVPVHAVRRGHPPIFAAPLFAELRELSEEHEGLHDVLRRHASQVHLVEVDSPLVHVDLNRPEDYEAALKPA